MTKVLHIAQGQPVSEWFLDELQEYLATYASPNFLITIQSNTVLQCIAGPGNDQVGLAINDPSGSPTGYAFRWNTATITASAPGSLIVGDNDVYVTSYVAGPFSSNPSPPPTQIDAAPSLNFGLAVLPPGTPPSGSSAVAWYRKVAKATWDGAKFTKVTMTVGGGGAPAVHAFSHLGGGTDPIAWSTVHGIGTAASRPTAAAANLGYTYFATDTNGGTLYESTGAAWQQLGVGLTSAITPGAHETSHLTGGSDALPWEASIHGRGAMAARPAYSAALAGYTYFATDTGVLYRASSISTSWEQVAPAILHAAAHLGGAADAISWGTVISQGLASARPAAVAANTGYVYFATDTSGGTLYRSTGAAWTQIASGLTASALPAAHASTHLAGGSDAVTWTTVHGKGTTAARPAAASTNAGYIYFATDTGGGTLYLSDGAAWTQIGIGLTSGPAPGAHETTHLPAGSDALPWLTQINQQGTFASRPSAAAGNAGLCYLATDTNGGTLYESTGAAWVQLAAGVTVAPQLHAASHLAGAADAIGWTTVISAGTFASRPAAASSNNGYIYLATDINGGTSYRSNGASWAQMGGPATPPAAAPAAHETTHLPGGSDALPWSTAINAQGTLASRPAAAAGNAGYDYLATDTNGGTLYSSTGAAWSQAAGPVTLPSSNRLTSVGMVVHRTPYGNDRHMESGLAAQDASVTFTDAYGTGPNVATAQQGGGGGPTVGTPTTTGFTTGHYNSPGYSGSTFWIVEGAD